MCRGRGGAQSWAGASGGHCARRWTGTRATDIGIHGDTTSLDNPLVNTLLVLAVAEVNLKVVDGCAGTRGVQLARAVMAADTREVLVLDLLARLDVVGVGHRSQSFHVHGRITHYPFEGIIGVGLL